MKPEAATLLPYGTAAASAIGNKRENDLCVIVESEAEIEGSRVLWDS